jgi:hypothetical protein
MQRPGVLSGTYTTQAAFGVKKRVNYGVDEGKETWLFYARYDGTLYATNIYMSGY